jgi:hypothetical protein
VELPREFAQRSMPHWRQHPIRRSMHLPGHGNALHTGSALRQAAGGAGQERQRRRQAEAGKKLAAVSLTLVSFAVTRKAYEKITQRFAKEYEAATGQPVRFRLSFGGSGTQARVPSPIHLTRSLLFAASHAQDAPHHVAVRCCDTACSALEAGGTPCLPSGTACRIGWEHTA